MNQNVVPTDFYCSLKRHASIIRIEGDDAVTFLQGQTTCDVREVSEQQSRLGAICNPKGRVICIFRLLKWQDEYLMVLASELLPMVLKRLRMYVLRAKVSLTDATTELTVLGLAGSACKIFEPQFESLTASQVCASDDHCLVRISDHSDRACLIINSDQLSSVEDLSNQAQIQTTDFAAWHRLELRDGLPRIYPDTQELFVPQMINLDLLGGISFKKGCYTGQEIVARMHYLGNLKKRMDLFSASEFCAPGSRLYLKNDSDQSVGTIVDCAQDGPDRFLVLAVCQIQIDAEAPLFLENSTTFIVREQLPYATQMKD